MFVSSPDAFFHSSTFHNARLHFSNIRCVFINTPLTKETEGFLLCRSSRRSKLFISAAFLCLFASLVSFISANSYTLFLEAPFPMRPEKGGRNGRFLKNRAYVCSLIFCYLSRTFRYFEMAIIDYYTPRDWVLDFSLGSACSMRAKPEVYRGEKVLTCEAHMLFFARPNCLN